MTSTKSWLFTINNYTERDIKWLESLEVNAMTVGKEVGENGTPHLQGFVTWKRTYRLGALKKLHEKAHWEPAKACDAANYCRKGEVIIDIKKSNQGYRNDIDTAYEKAREGIPMSEYLEHKPNHQCIKIFEIAKKTFQKDRTFKPELTWIWGPSGVGKTRMVFEKEPDLWISGKNLRWWEDYENQEAVLFDDFRGDFCTFHELLRILDRYPYTVEVKGGSRKLNSKRMYITSCYPPERIYETREDIYQLQRRIDNVIKLETPMVVLDSESVTVTETEVQRGNTNSLDYQNRGTEPSSLPLTTPETYGGA